MACDFRLEVFMTLCRTGSFTKAADTLGISQPAVSQNIAELEKDLGVKLFSRSRGEVSLTSDGILFRSYAERILYWYESARSAFRHGEDTPGQISVYSSADLSPAIVPELFSVLRHSYPDLSFVSMTGTPDMHPADYGKEYALYLYSSVSRNGRAEAESGKEDQYIGAGFPVAAVSPLSRHIHESAALCSGTDFSALPELAVLSSGRMVLDELEVSGLSGRIAFISDSAEAVKHLALADPDVAAVLPWYCVQEDLSAGKLVQLPSPWLDFRYSVFMRISEAVRQLPVFEDIMRVLRDLLHSDPHMSM